MSFLFEEDSPPRKITVLGSTGSIGKQTLDVVREHPDRFTVVALAAHSDASTLFEQAAEFHVQTVALEGESQSRPDGVSVITGPDSAARLVGELDTEIVLNAVMGAAGLKATMAAISAGRTLALANKESLVAGGEAVMSKASPGQIRPVDSEHSALWQLLDGGSMEAVARVILTSSGGPFRGSSSSELEGVTVEQALAHPTWAMGRKITIDSATLMNKGLEVIEAHFLFGLTYDEIDVLVHPQSIVHGLVELVDGSMLAHSAVPDMRLPIQVALSWPQRLRSEQLQRIDLTQAPLTFEAPDTETFVCLRLAYEAGRQGDTYPAAMNAANEIAVGAFLDGKIRLPDIFGVVEQVLETHKPTEATIDAVIEQDAVARDAAASLVERIGVSR
ncbi:MAG TPA: 1-deoxy-D-xylulose-5-phosphate reductoisomerase [Actinomycetota bacterium]|nr:1-deoxy-D-xylulose-5-phosphate reductoisomerase [Actinomycetota bacterium]